MTFGYTSEDAVDFGSRVTQSIAGKQAGAIPLEANMTTHMELGDGAVRGAEIGPKIRHA